MASQRNSSGRDPCDLLKLSHTTGLCFFNLDKKVIEEARGDLLQIQITT